MTDRCPHCQQLLPGSIQRFPSVSGTLRRRVVECIADNPGICASDMVGIVYRNVPPHQIPTGPEKVIHVIMTIIKKQLAIDGYKIISSTGKGGGYRLERLPPPEPVAAAIDW